MDTRMYDEVWTREAWQPCAQALCVGMKLEAQIRGCEMKCGQEVWIRSYSHVSSDGLRHQKIISPTVYTLFDVHCYTMELTLSQYTSLSKPPYLRQTMFTTTITVLFPPQRNAIHQPPFTWVIDHQEFFPFTPHHTFLPQTLSLLPHTTHSCYHGLFPFYPTPHILPQTLPTLPDSIDTSQCSIQHTSIYSIPQLLMAIRIYYYSKKEALITHI